jgi:hypothetical protein
MLFVMLFFLLLLLLVVVVGLLVALNRYLWFWYRCHSHVVDMCFARKSRQLWQGTLRCHNRAFHMFLPRSGLLREGCCWRMAEGVGGKELRATKH